MRQWKIIAEGSGSEIRISKSEIIIHMCEVVMSKNWLFWWIFPSSETAIRKAPIDQSSHFLFLFSEIRNELKIPYIVLLSLVSLLEIVLFRLQLADALMERLDLLLKLIYELLLLQFIIIPIKSLRKNVYSPLNHKVNVVCNYNQGRAFTFMWLVEEYIFFIELVEYQKSTLRSAGRSPDASIPFITAAMKICEGKD